MYDNREEREREKERGRVRTGKRRRKRKRRKEGEGVQKQDAWREGELDGREGVREEGGKMERER